MVTTHNPIGHRRKHALLLLLLLLLAMPNAAQQAVQPMLNPLTGQPLPDPERPRRPIIVKISNAPALVRPQAGIGAADWLFEHYTEAGVTRFSAVFFAQAPQRVGSIRSARLIDTQLVPMFNGLLAFAGASIGVDKAIYGADAVIEGLCRTRSDRQQCYREAASIAPTGDVPASSFADRAYKGTDVGQPIYYRDARVPVPHNLFVDVAALWEQAARDGHAQLPDLFGLNFASEPSATASEAADGVQVRYQTTLAQWDYDTINGVYLRSTDGQAHRDALTNTQLSAANVLVIYADHRETDIIESEFLGTTYYSLHINLLGNGDALALRDGEAFNITWQRNAADALFSFGLPDGTPYALKPGNTAVQVVPLPAQLQPEREWVRLLN